MEWLIMGGGLSATATNLGYQEDSRYVITAECHDVLGQLLNNIMRESKVKCQARRSVANSRLIQMDLIPIICHSGDDPDVFDAVVRLLMHLSMPLEVIMPIVKKLTQEDYQKRHELQKMLETIKKEFTQHKVIAALVSQMATIIEEAGTYPIDKTNAETLSNCLTLLRNVLYVNYERYKVGSLKNDTIIGNLFKCGFHDVLKEMCRRSEGGKWLSSLLQVLHLMYKDTSSTKMVNYMRKKQEVPTAPPTGTTGKDNQMEVDKDECKSLQSEQTEDDDESVELDVASTSDATPEENLVTLISSLSSIVSDATADQSALSGGQSEDGSTEEDGSSRTITRSDSPGLDSEDSTIQEGSTQSCSMSSMSSDSSEDNSDTGGIMNLKRRNMKNLAEFALDYIKHGMDNILMQCKNDLKNMVSNHYFLWQLNFFLPFTTLPHVSYTDVKLTLSAPVFSQLLSSCMRTWEEFLQASTQRNNDSKSNSVFKILNMQVTTLRQMLNSIQKFSTNPQSTDVIHMKTVLATIALTKTVRNFYHLLIRKFQPQQQTLAFLREIILGNDLVLRIIDQVQHIHRPEWGKVNMVDHIKKFASRPIMRVYNYMLSKFSHNTLEENEVVMTMLHHIAVDIGQVEVIYQIPILTTFANLWEEGSRHISKESQDLIDYIVREFCILGSKDKEKCLQTVTMMDNPRPHKRKHRAETESDGKKHKSLDTLLEGNHKGLFVPRDESDDEMDGPESVDEQTGKPRPAQAQSVEDCLRALRKKGFGQEIIDIQEVLLEICYLKLNSPKVHIGEPHIWHCCSDGKSVPIVAFTEKAEHVQNDHHFKTLLHKLGLHTSHDTGRLYPSIPAFWTSDMCYKAATTLGDIAPDAMKFDLDVKGLPLECSEGSSMTKDKMFDVEDLDLLEDQQQKSSISPVYFQIPDRMWCHVIKRANSAKAK